MYLWVLRVKFLTIYVLGPRLTCLLFNSNLSRLALGAITNIHLINRLLSHFNFLFFFLRFRRMLVDEFRESATALHQLLVGPLGVDPPVLHDDDVVHVRQEADAVRGQDPGAIFKHTGLGAENPLDRVG